MKILHISLIRQGSDYARLRYFWDNPNNYQEKRHFLAEIKGLNNIFCPLGIDYPENVGTLIIVG